MKPLVGALIVLAGCTLWGLAVAGYTITAHNVGLAEFSCWCGAAVAAAGFVVVTRGNSTDSGVG